LDLNISREQTQGERIGDIFKHENQNENQAIRVGDALTLKLLLHLQALKEDQKPGL
jgi:hypothetical protein